MTAPTSPVTVLHVRGTGEDAGQAYGRACRDLVQRHLARVLERLSREHEMSATEAYSRALPYRAHTARTHPHLAAEVDGVSAGAGLPLAAAWVLQLRAELAHGVAAVPECTTVAVTGAASATGATVAGQNVDLPSAYADILVVLRREVPGRPTLMTLTPAGQIGHHGMNDAGVVVLANFLHSDGWRVGTPRYLLTRIALAEHSRTAAVAAVERTERASPRNVLIADDTGATALETTPTDAARVDSAGGLLTHTNHYVSRLADQDTADEPWLRNSRRRLRRVTALLSAAEKPVGVPQIAAALRDRDGAPDAICHLRADDDIDYATVASTIADTRHRRLWIALGPPHEAEYRPYDVNPLDG